jgi:hypothetical protein
MQYRAVTIALAGIVVLAFLRCREDDRLSNKVRPLKAENATPRRQSQPQDSYKCKVLTANTLDDRGLLTKAAQHIEVQVVGATFFVNRNTGWISGAIGSNETFESRTVVFTPPDNPFYVVSFTHGPNRNVDFLSIRDWVEPAEKPFLLVDSALMFTGTCTR